jgi:hypothetical protein
MKLLDIRTTIKASLHVSGTFVIFFSMASCRKFVQISPPQTQLVSANVFANDLTATSAMNGVYVSMLGNDFASGGSYSVTLAGGLSADELTNFSASPDQIGIANNTIVPTNGVISLMWSSAYHDIYSCNAILQGISNSTGMSTAAKQELTGEAKFIRAFSYFYLATLFGDVPLDTTTAYQANAGAARTPRAKVYQQIVTDLLSAQSLLAGDYSYSNGERVRPNQWAATALLARVYLFTGNWTNAEKEATTVISDSTLFKIVGTLSSVFLKNSNEAIWQLRPISTTQNTNEGSMFILLSVPSKVALSNRVLNAFEPGDYRRISWVDSIKVGSSTYYFPYKYRVSVSPTLSEYSMMLRLSEQYLIRAEARAQQGTNLTGAAADLNVIRNRAGLLATAAITRDSLLPAIYHERQTELFTEWGHRWLDIIRTGLAPGILAPIKPSWSTAAELYPIPLAELQNNTDERQNPGY